MQVGKALYSVPGELVGRRLDARSDAHTVKLYWRGELINSTPWSRRDGATPIPLTNPTRYRSMRCGI